MAERAQRATLSGFLVVAAVGLGIVLLVDTTQELNAPDTFGDEAPDLFIEGGEITTFTEDGDIDYRLKARRIDYYREEDTSYLIDPTLFVHDHETAPWQIDAESGEGHALSSSNSTLRLERDVRALQERSDGTFTRLNSEVITVFPDRRIARSSEPVTIETEGYTLRAVGFETDLRTGRIRLGSTDDQRGELTVRASNG